MAAESAAWTLAGIEPKDNTFRDAGADVHRAFWKFIATKGVERFRRRCNAGLDRNGAGLTGIAESTRRKGRWRSHTGRGTADNPPLSPALGLSRTQDLLRGRGFADHAEWHWRFDAVSGRHWGQVLLWHRAGKGRLPRRDVIGWSRDDIADLQFEGSKWWYAFRNGQAVAAAAKRLELPAQRFEQLRNRQPAKIAVTGRIDLANYTAGIGGTKEMVQRSIDAGYSSGFSKAGPYKPRQRPGGGAMPAPAPKPAAPRAAPPKPIPVYKIAAKHTPPPAPHLPSAPPENVPGPKPISKPAAAKGGGVATATNAKPTTKPISTEHQSQLDQVARNQEREVAYYAARLGVSTETYRSKLRAGLQSAVDEGEFYVRASHDTALAILDSGRFKSQFEVGRSSAAFDPAARKRVEERLMGLAENTPPAQRPIYGYVSDPGFASYAGPGETDVAHYGEASFRLKPHVRQRATVTVGDSLNFQEATVASPAGAQSESSIPITGRTFAAEISADLFGAKSGPEFLSAAQRHFRYIEAQYQGGLSTEDIAEVAFGETPSEKVREALKTRGIPWRVIEK